MNRRRYFAVGQILQRGARMQDNPLAQGSAIQGRGHSGGKVRNLIRKAVSRVARRIAREVWRNEPPPARSQYEALALLAMRYGFHGLSAAELRVFSQNGEDGVLAEIFSKIGTTNQFFVEFGVQDGIECNSFFRWRSSVGLACTSSRTSTRSPGCRSDYKIVTTFSPSASS